MAENAQEQLLGYLLDALEDEERQQLQQDLLLALKTSNISVPHPGRGGPLTRPLLNKV